MAELPMLVERPSSSYSQETSHILLSTFRDIVGLDNIDEELVENLSVSKGSENAFHTHYVESLQKIHKKWSKKIVAIEEMISHLDKAKTQARKLEEEEERKTTEEFEKYAELGLPPMPSKLDEFIDDVLLRKNNLVVPKDFLRYEPQVLHNEVKDQSTPPQYQNTTFSSKQMFNKMPPNDNYQPDPEPMLPKSTRVYNKERKSPKRPSKLKTSVSDRNAWRSSLKPKQRGEERKEMLRMQNRADFLKNPRFDKKPKSLISQDGDMANPFKTFEVDPYPIIFQDYEVGKTYEMKLELRNVTTSSRQIRVMGPSTNNFKLSYGEFPTEDGLVAPGISCFYTVSFTPTSLADYNDMLQVKSQDDEPVFIPLQGRRLPPCLTLPSELECGYGLAGNCKTIVYTVQNLGGPGRFIFSERKFEENEIIKWDEIPFPDESALELSPFRIKPEKFQLNSHEKVSVTIIFNPKQLNAFQTSVYLYCDNCCVDTYYITGTSEIAHVRVDDVEGGVTRPMLGETYDASAEQTVVFQKCHPGVVYKREVSIRNCVSVPLQFEWKIYYPTPSNRRTNQSERSLNSKSVFQVQPCSGYLEEQSVTKFEIFFQPDCVNDWFDVVALILKDIPTASSDEVFEKKDKIFIQFAVKGDTQHFNVVADPPLILMCGKFFIGISYHRTVKLRNHSNENTSFEWKPIDCDEYSIVISPTVGEIGADGDVDVLLTITGKKSGLYKILVPFDVPYLNEPSALFVQCQFVGPRIIFEENDVSFGLVRLGTFAEKYFTLRNESPIDGSWNLAVKNENNVGSQLLLSCKEGILPAHSKQSIIIKFIPGQEMTLHGVLQCLVDDGKTSYLSMYGEVQRPFVYIEEPEIRIDEVFVNVPIRKTVIFSSTTLLSADLRFVQCRNSECDVSMVGISCVEILPLGRVPVLMEFVFKKLGEIECVIEFEVLEMLDPLVFIVQTDVKGLMVDVTVPNMYDIENQTEHIRQNDVIEFSDRVMLGQVREALVVMENRSAISTPFQLYFKEFQTAIVPTPPTMGGPPLKSKNSSSRPLLTKMSNFADNTNVRKEQTAKEYSSALLRDGKGVGFLCTMSSGVLEAFERKIITVAVYSDMWGRYNDLLVCQFGENFQRLIPIVCEVTGSPLNFQMTKDRLPIVRFGVHPSAGISVKRSLKINNTSYVDIRLDWQTFLVDPDDDQIIDLNCYYGNPFPVVDQDGNEVVNENDGWDEDDLIKVILSEHQGKRTEVPFVVENKQMVVPAQGHSFLELSFTPPAGMTREKDFNGYALGYMSLEAKDRQLGGKVMRLDGIEMLPFGLNMTGSVKPAKLFLEACDEEEFTFELPVTDLLDGGDLKMIKEQISCSHRYVITNHCGTTVSFRCLLQPPFHLLSPNENQQYTLKPNMNTEIRIAFRLTRYIATSHRNGDVMKVQRDLIFEFPNKTTQCYTLTGIVNYPSIQANQKVLDFGNCFVGEERELILHISNPSKAVLYWGITKDSRCPLASRNAFEIKECSGKIESNLSEETGHSVDVCIRFIASHNVKYECTILLSSQFRTMYLGDEAEKIVLRGQGSYNEAMRENIV